MGFTIAIVMPRAFRRYRVMSGGGCATKGNILSKIANYLFFFFMPLRAPQEVRINVVCHSLIFMCVPGASQFVLPNF